MVGVEEDGVKWTTVREVVSCYEAHGVPLPRWVRYFEKDLVTKSWLFLNISSQNPGCFSNSPREFLAVFQYLSLAFLAGIAMCGVCFGACLDVDA